MLDIGWQELLVIGALALIVVGPRDLPSLLRSVGQWVGRVRGMAREFQRTMNDAARETDLANMAELREIRKINPLNDFKEQAAKAQSFLDNPASAVTELEKKPSEDGDGAKNAVEDEPDPGQVAAEAHDPEPLETARADTSDEPAPSAKASTQ